MTLIKLPDHPVKVASASATELAFSSGDAPSAKLSLNINAFNGNKTNFGGKCNGNK
jgi:hypothetical protein